MKKFLVLTLAVLMILLASCGKTDVSNDTTGGTKTTTKSPETTAVPQTTDDSDDTTIPDETTKTPDETTKTPDETTTVPTDENIKIGTLDELLAFMNAPVLDGDYVLTNDIVFNDISNISTWAETAPANTWTPVGTAEAPFYGTFDGQGHTISGLYVNVDKSAGFFGCISNATIENLIIGEGYIYTAGSVAGGIAAYYYGFTDITGCVNYANVTAKAYLGGIVGKYTESGGLDVNIKFCVNRGDIIGTLDTSAGYVGGIIGSSVGVKIDNCANFGNISIGVGISDKGALIGGIAGCMGSSQGYSESITNCYNAGTITSTQSTGNAATAGIVGRMNISEGEVANCYNIGQIYVGGNSLTMTAFVASENKDHLDYTRNVYNSGEMLLIGTAETATPSFTEKGLSGTVATGLGAVATMNFDASIWEDNALGAPLLKGIDSIHQQLIP